MTARGTRLRQDAGDVLLLACMLSLTGCARSTRVPIPDLTVRRGELRAAALAVDAQMSRDGFVQPLAAAFAPTGVYISPLPLADRGPEAARTWLLSDSLNATSRARWTVVRHDVSADGVDGYTYGDFLVVRASGDSLPGSYKAYWRRDANGRWRLLAMQRARGASFLAFQDVPEWVRQARRAAPQRGDTVRMLGMVMDTERAFSDAAANGVGAAFEVFAAPDGAKAGPAGYVFGPAAIAGLFTGPVPPSGGPKWTPELGSVSASGDLAFTTGPVVPRNPGAAPYPAGAKYFTIWRLMPNGRWRYVVD